MSVFAVWCPAAGDDPDFAETFLVDDACEAAKAYVDQNAEVANGADVVRVLVQNLGRPDPTRTLAELRKRVGEPTTKIFAVDVLIEYELKLSAKIADDAAERVRQAQRAMMDGTSSTSGGKS